MRIYNKKRDKELDFKIVVTAYDYVTYDYVVLVFNDFDDYELIESSIKLTFVSKIIEVTDNGALVNTYLLSTNITTEQEFIDYCYTLWKDK